MDERDVIDKIPEGKENAILKSKLVGILCKEHNLKSRAVEKHIAKARLKPFVHSRNPTREEKKKEKLRQNQVLFYWEHKFENKELKEIHTDELREVISKWLEQLPRIEKGVIIEYNGNQKPHNIEWSGLRVKIGNLPDKFVKIIDAFDENGVQMKPFLPNGIYEIDNAPYIGQPLKIEENPTFDDLVKHHIPDVYEKFNRFKINIYSAFSSNRNIKNLNVEIDKELIFCVVSNPFLIKDMVCDDAFEDAMQLIQSIAKNVTSEHNIPKVGILDLLEEVRHDLKNAERNVFFEDCPVIKRYILEKEETK